MMSFTSIVKTSSYVETNPNATGGTITNTFSQNTEVDATTTDILPSYNLAMWVVPDKVVLRYSHAKTVARPPVTQLLPAGNCTYDQRLADVNAAQRCSGTIGNPALQARTNVNQNLSVEYYPNKDTMFTFATLRQDGRIGAAIAQGSKLPLFAGNDLIDPGTGIKLSELPFDYSTWMNSATTTRSGIEAGTKTAFTFLPWYLRYTGFDANYTKLRSVASAVNVVDLLTGDPLPPARESKYQYNAALWYDDGQFSARVALQVVASSFTCIAGCGQLGMRNYPSGAGGQMSTLPYSPGSPNFKDATRFIDGKIGYKWKPGVEFFIEGRNLGNATTTNSQGPYAPFADGTPNLLDYAYSGRRIMVGVNLRTM
jgi:TonB-dependent receptor